MEKTTLTRRNFFKATLAAASLGAFSVWDKMVKTKAIASVKKHWKFPFNPNKKVSFVDEFIVVNSVGKTEVLSAHCSHLGCLINQTNGDKLVCPCHGSEFATNGEVIKGPAYKPLKKVTFHFSEKKDLVVIG